MLFRKKHEFRPDKTHSGLLGKLYITKKQRLNLLKWLLMAAVLALISVVQDVILSQVSLFGATTDLLCGALLLVCIMLDPEEGCIFILAGSCLYHFSGSSPGPYTIALLTAIGLVAGIFRHAYLYKSFGSVFLCAALAIMAYEMILFALGLFLGATTAHRLPVFALSGAYTVVLMPLLYPIFRSISKIGGESWKE